MIEQRIEGATIVMLFANLAGLCYCHASSLAVSWVSQSHCPTSTLSPSSNHHKKNRSRSI